MIWSGAIQSVGGPPQLLRFEISTAPARTFLILPPGATPENGSVTASEIQFTGVTVRFNASFGHGATCKLDAIPARGYKGTCTLNTGETQDLTLAPPVPGMLLPEHEIILSRDAGPPNISGEASVFVLGRTGLVRAIAGTNGFTCYVRRPTVNDFWSICQNREAATLLQAEQLRARLRTAGLDERRVADSVAAWRDARVIPHRSGPVAQSDREREVTVAVTAVSSPLTF